MFDPEDGSLVAPEDSLMTSDLLRFSQVVRYCNAHNLDETPSKTMLYRTKNDQSGVFADYWMAMTGRKLRKSRNNLHTSLRRLRQCNLQQYWYKERQ